MAALKHLTREILTSLPLHALHFALTTRAKATMPPPENPHNDLLARIIRNIEQAQGRLRHHATTVDIVQAPANVESELVSLSSTDMPGPAPPPSLGDAATPEQDNTPINLTSDLAASTTLLQSLRTRNSILVDDLARAAQSLLRHEGKAGKELSNERSSKVKWMIAATCSLAVWAVYVWWCWYMRVEFEYIRKRRGEVFGV